MTDAQQPQTPTPQDSFKAEANPTFVLRDLGHDRDRNGLLTSERQYTLNITNGPMHFSARLLRDMFQDCEVVFAGAEPRLEIVETTNFGLLSDRKPQPKL